MYHSDRNSQYKKNFDRTRPVKPGRNRRKTEMVFPEVTKKLTIQKPEEYGEDPCGHRHSRGI